MSKPTKKEPKVTLLEHEYDGIQEYDQHLPNWWLFTLYGAIVFSVGYWFFYFQTNPFDSDITRLHAEMAQVQEAQLAASLKMLDDNMLWEQSRSPEFVNAGRAVFMESCVACHGADLKGGIGFNLVDSEWVHGGKPVEIFGVIAKGAYTPEGQPTAMQAWESILGSRKIAEVVAFILSHHQQPPAETAPAAE